MTHSSSHGGASDQQSILPAPPRPPREVNLEWANQQARWLEGLYRWVSGTPHLTLSGLFFPPGSLATTGYGLKPGEVFSNDGILTIVREGDIWAGGFGITVSVGTVTVTVT